MKNILLLIVAASCALIVITIFAINLWLQMSDIQISYNGLVAIFTGAFFTILLGVSLMSLVFFSARYGFDEQVDHDLESLLERHKDS